MNFLRPLSAAVALACLAGLSGCGGNGADKKAADGAPGPARPPAAPEGALHRAKIVLDGGPFSPPLTLNISTEPPAAKFEVFPDGFRLQVTDPDKARNLQAHRWGVWIYAEGKLKEESMLGCRTGTQVVIDGVSYAPAVKAKSSSGPTNHALQATIEITRFEPERGIFEGDFTANLLAPDGKTAVMLTGDIKLPWPKESADSTEGNTP